MTVILIFCHSISAWGYAGTLPQLDPESLGMDSVRLSAIQEVVTEGLKRENMPGAVVLVGRRNGIAYYQAFGNRRVQPSTEPMLPDTVFDLASLTKPIATATSAMLLIEQGKLDPSATVASYLPEFAANGKAGITVLQLLTHQSGLIPDNALADYELGFDEAFQRIFALHPTTEPGTKFIYSDVNFIVLGALIRKISGLGVDQFSQQYIFGPLRMSETGFRPPEHLRVRCAPTEQRDGRWMQGEVHDPRAFLLDGVAGHAGLFSTARDLARYASMMLNSGHLDDVRILKPETVEKMTRAYQVSSGLRGLGWDMRTGFSSNRGDMMSDRAFGHGGFTGTGIWIDPKNDLYVIFLSNRVHPNGKGSVNSLIGRIGTIAVASIQQSIESNSLTSVASPAVLNGIDVLERDNFAALDGCRAGLITNQTGTNRQGVSTVSLLHQAVNVDLRVLFSPEHGLQGRLDVANIADTKDEATGLNVFSLYGDSRRPSPDSLEGLDTLVFDIQDIGCRFYTYPSTMGNAMRAAAENGLRFVVLDRVNPLGGMTVAGPVLDAGSESFVGYHTVPVQHGMTLGEYALLMKSEMNIDVNLEVIRIEGWKRHQTFDHCNLRWINPSPNMRSLTQAVLYPGIGLLEMTNVSVGRGTDTPFEIVGAPWIQELELAALLNQSRLPGVAFVPIRFTPSSSRYANISCGGVNIVITDRSRFRAVSVGIQLMCALRRLYDEHWETTHINRLLANQQVSEAILSGETAEVVESLWLQSLQDFEKRRQTVLLYD